MDDEETKKLLEEGARAADKLRRLDEALKVVVKEQEALVSLQQDMTESIRMLQEGANRIRTGCDSFNAEMEKHGIGVKRQAETVAAASFLEGWAPPTDRVH